MKSIVKRWLRKWFKEMIKVIKRKCKSNLLKPYNLIKKVHQKKVKNKKPNLKLLDFSKKQVENLMILWGN